MLVCPSCGESNPDRFRLCGFCGTPLAAAVPRARSAGRSHRVQRPAGSTKLGEALDPESVRAVMSRYFDAMTAALRRHGGTIEKFIGDAIMAVFGLPGSMRMTRCGPYAPRRRKRPSRRSTTSSNGTSESASRTARASTRARS